MTFEPDQGGWNNIRMQMETVFVFAAATGRTLVLPPEQPMYLLNKDAKDNFHSFMDFFPLSELGSRMDIISMEEFLTREGLSGYLGPPPPKNRTNWQIGRASCRERVL